MDASITWGMPIWRCPHTSAYVFDSATSLRLYSSSYSYYYTITIAKLEKHGNHIIFVGRDSHTRHGVLDSYNIRVLLFVHQNCVVYDSRGFTGPHVYR